MFENVLKGLLREARRNPLMLFMDDLQWADPSTLALMHYLSRNTRNSRIFIVGNYRTEDVLETQEGRAHPLTDTIQLMNREGLMERMELRKLGRAAVAAIVKENLGEMERGDEFGEFIWNETQGNPLFVLEVINLLKSEGSLTCRDSKWSLGRRLESIDIPAKVHDVISRRLSKLLKGQRQILEQASVIGDIFSSDVLTKVTDIKRIDLLKSLNEIERSHGLIVSMEKQYSFSHVKVRDVLYNGMSKELKSEYHLIVGQTMSALYGATDECVAEIGYHYYMAKDAAKAIPKLMRAIELAKGKFANEEAIRYSGYALELMGCDPEKWAIETINVLESLGDVKELTGRYDEAMAAYERILDLSKDLETCARAHRKLASSLQSKGQYERAFEELETGNALLERKGGAELGRVLTKMASIFEHDGKYDRAISALDQAMGILKNYSDTGRDVADALHKMGHLHACKGDYDGALTSYEDSVKGFEAIGDLRGTGMALNSIGSILADRDRNDEALVIFERCLMAFEKLGDPTAVGVALNNLGIVYKSRCEYDKALANYARCLEVFGRLGNPRGIGSSLNNIGIIKYTRGDYKGALECYEKALVMFERIKDRLSMGMMKLNIGLVHLELGDLDPAKVELEWVERLASEMGNKRILVDAWQGLGQLLMRTGRSEEAQEKLVKTIELSKQMGVKETEGISYRLLGMMMAGMGRWEDAAREFERSISVLAGSKIRIELAETYLEYGRALKMRGDGLKANSAFDESLRLFKEMNLVHKIETVEKEMMDR